MRKSRPLLLSAALFLTVSLLLASAAAQNQTRTIAGHVRGSQDKPLPKAVVYLKNTKSLAIKTYITDADGAFHFPALFPNVDYEIYAAFEGAHSDTKTISAFDSHKEINMTLHIHTDK